MQRTNCNKNNNSEQRLVVSNLSPEERIRFLANLIIDKILEDQKSGQVILHTISKK